jgi:hypothetical protein
MKKAAVLLAAAVFVMLAAPAALATHRPDHQEPPACQNSQGQAPVKNKHCYPPQQGQQASQAGKKASFEIKRDGGITIGVLVIAGLGAFTLFLGTSAVLRRRLIS